MEIRGLGYVGIGTSDLSDWTRFATDWLGMQMVERGNTARAFRMDDRSQRLVVDRSLADGERYFGFEVADADALQSLAARLDAAGVAGPGSQSRRPINVSSRNSSVSMTRAATGWRPFTAPPLPAHRSVLAAQFPASEPARWGWGMSCSMSITWTICWAFIAIFWDLVSATTS